MRKRLSKENSPELCFYYFFDPKNQKRQNYCIIGGIALFFLLFFFFNVVGMMIGIGGLCGILRSINAQKEKRQCFCIRPSGVRCLVMVGDSLVWRRFFWHEIQDMHLLGAAFGQRWMLRVDITYMEEKLGRKHEYFIYDDLEPFYDKLKEAEQWILRYQKAES